MLRIADSLEMRQWKVKKIMEKLFDCIGDSLIKDGRIHIRHFGIFKVRQRRERKTRNPKTGEKFLTPAYRISVFKPALRLKKRINQSIIKDDFE